MTTTVDKLTEMLTENTGRSCLDSGSCYGRGWEQNQGVNFEAQPEGRLECGNCEGDLDIMPTLNVYHFLKDRLEYNSELDTDYQEFCENEELNLDVHSAEDFVKSLNNAAGIYGEGEPFTVNTYNGEDLLSQIIQYHYWSDEKGAHVMLQIHGGCDARGGYTYPVAFDVIDDDGTSILHNTGATIHCDSCNRRWDTDDGCHWSIDGEPCTELQMYPATDRRPEYPQPSPTEQANVYANVVWVDDNSGHCPFCGNILQVWACPI